MLVPYLEGERTPNRPHATGALHGLRLRTSTPAHLARAAVEGMLCALADGLDALTAQGARVSRVILVGGGARSEAVRRIAPSRLRRARAGAAARRSTSPTAPPARPPGSCWAAPSLHSGRSRAPSSYEADAAPGGPPGVRRARTTCWTWSPAQGLLGA